MESDQDMLGLESAPAQQASGQNEHGALDAYADEVREKEQQQTAPESTPTNSDTQAMPPPPPPTSSQNRKRKYNMSAKALAQRRNASKRYQEIMQQAKDLLYAEQKRKTSAIQAATHHEQRPLNDPTPQMSTTSIKRIVEQQQEPLGFKYREEQKQTKRARRGLPDINELTEEEMAVGRNSAAMQSSAASASHHAMAIDEVAPHTTSTPPPPRNTFDPETMRQIMREEIQSILKTRHTPKPAQPPAAKQFKNALVQSGFMRF